MLDETGTEETTVVATVETIAVSSEPVTTPATVETAPASAGVADLGKVRELVLKANPGVVPDLIQGGTVDELIASVEPARSAYQRVADAVRQGSGTETVVKGTPGDRGSTTEETAVVTPPPVPAVPAGGATNVVDPASIPPSEKIARALAERRRA